MSELRQRRALLKALVAKHHKLAAEVWRKHHEVDQLLAVRKETRRSSLKAHQPGALDHEPSTLNVSALRPPIKPGAPSQNGLRKKDPGYPAVIVVEDQPNEFAAIKQAFWRAGATARVWWAHSQSEALSILGQLEESVASICVVADLCPCGGDGFELMASIRARPKTIQLRFAFLAKQDNPTARDRAAHCGADAFFVRPGTAGELIEIARALQKLAKSSDNASL